jgi:hypothetical protein
MSGWRVAAAFTTVPSHPQANHAQSRSGAASNAATPLSRRLSSLPSLRSSISSSPARAEMTEADWWAKFGRPWSPITQQILPAFSDAIVAQAREKAKALERQPYLPLEART